MSDLPTPTSIFEIDVLVDRMLERKGRDGLPGGHRSLRVTDDFVPIAYWPAENEDGEEVELAVACAPARFYRIRWKDHELGTGSSAEGLSLEICKAIAEGCLVLK